MIAMKNTDKTCPGARKLHYKKILPIQNCVVPTHFCMLVTLKMLVNRLSYTFFNKGNRTYLSLLCFVMPFVLQCMLRHINIDWADIENFI